MWENLRARRIGLKFRRQIVMMGWIVDFYCPLLGLAIEADGSAHDGQEAYDKHRDSVLRGMGLTVLRFPSYQIINDWPSVRLAIQLEARRIRLLSDSACK